MDNFAINAINLWEMKENFLATFETSLPGAYARNLLIVSGDTVYQEPIILPNEGLKQSNRIKFRGVREPNADQPFTIFPNPADDYFILKTNLPEVETSGIIRIMDRNGLILKEFGYKRKQDQLVIDCKDLLPGLYLIQILVENRSSGIIKLVVI